jgi:hypothetical protein
MDRVFWVALRRLWSRWSDVLIVVKPETIVGWHWFQLYWRLRSRASQLGRPQINTELLIRPMAAEKMIAGQERVNHIIEQDMRRRKLESGDPNVFRIVRGLMTGKETIAWVR